MSQQVSIVDRKVYISVVCLSPFVACSVSSAGLNTSPEGKIPDRRVTAKKIPIRDKSWVFQKDSQGEGGRKGSQAPKGLLHSWGCVWGIANGGQEEE